MAKKKYASLNTLSDFLNALKNTFATLGHRHTMSDISDLAIDASLSSTSTNAVQNKVVDAEFEAVSEAIGTLDGVVNAVSGKTIDKIDEIDFWYSDVSDLSVDVSGIHWQDDYNISTDSNDYHGRGHYRVPIIAGDNVVFEVVNNGDQVIKINATGGGNVDTSNLVKKYVVELSGGETVADIISKLATTYPDYMLGEWSLVAFTGATTALYGLTINHYDGNIYNISGMDFGTYYTMANNVTDWSQVSVWAFSGYFQPPVPYCDESNNDQFLRVANGVPTWATVSNAEDNTF